LVERPPNPSLAPDVEPTRRVIGPDIRQDAVEVEELVDAGASGGQDTSSGAVPGDGAPGGVARLSYRGQPLGLNTHVELDAVHSGRHDLPYGTDRIRLVCTAAADDLVVGHGAIE
jgi:hypothetical protein